MRYYSILISAGEQQINLGAINGVMQAASGLVSGLASAVGLPTNIANQLATKVSSVPSSIAAVAGAIIGGSQWTSVVNGRNDPGALDIEFDITLAPDAHLISGHLKIYGIPQSVISQASNFNRTNIQIWAGMTNGLPLATLEMPHQGKIADGMILPCFGNWIGNELSIEFIINPGSNGVGGPTDPKNIIHNMPQGTSLSSAILNALNTALPDYAVNVNISPSLILNYPDQGAYQSIEQYQNYVKSLSHNILGYPDTTGYQGVTMFSSGKSVFVTDGTITGNTIPIMYEDLIGQPTWSPQGDNILQVKTVLRGDIAPATAGGTTQISLPNNLLVTTPTSAFGMFQGGQILQYQPGNVLNFTGAWKVAQVRHVGRFRQPTGEAWVTIIDAIAPFNTSNNVANNISGQQRFIPLGQGGIGHA